jgi:hypothetical protein
MKVVRLLALHTGHLYPTGNIPGTDFCERLSQPQGYSAAKRISKVFKKLKAKNLSIQCSKRNTLIII